MTMVATLLTIVALAYSDPLPLDPADLKAQPQVKLTVMEAGKPVVYSGVPMIYLLKSKLTIPAQMSELRKLADAAILIQAKDDFQAVYSAVEVGMDEKGERYLLALAKDGEPLADADGPVKIIAAGDRHRVRWVRMVKKATLVKVVP